MNLKGKELLTGRTFYKFDLDENDNAILKSFTLTNLREDLFPDDPYDRYEYEESYPFYRSTKNRKYPNIFCTKAVENEAYEEIFDAAQNIWDWVHAQGNIGESTSLYTKKIFNSKIFQETLKKYPSIELG